MFYHIGIFVHMLQNSLFPNFFILLGKCNSLSECSCKHARHLGCISSTGNRKQPEKAVSRCKNCAQSDRTQWRVLFYLSVLSCNLWVWKLKPMWKWRKDATPLAVIRSHIAFDSLFFTLVNTSLISLFFQLLVPSHCKLCSFCKLWCIWVK